MKANNTPVTAAHYNVAIVGAGVAGLVLSVLLKRAGINHVLLLRMEARRGLALGETLPPAAFALLDRLRLTELVEASAKRTFGYHSMWGSSRVVDQNFFGHQPRSYGLKLNKAALLELLLEEVQPNVREFDELTHVLVDAEGASLRIGTGTEETSIKATMLVDATGRARAVLKRLGINSKAFDETVAVSCHLPRIQHPRLTHGVYVESFAEGWGIVSQLDDERSAMTLFTNNRNPVLRSLKQYSSWHTALENTVLLKELLSAEALTKVAGRQANSSKATQLAGNCWLAAGDAAIAFDPLSSHGITNALYGASRAFEAIEQRIASPTGDAFAEYAKTLNSIFTEYLRQRTQRYATEQRWPSTFWQQAAKHATMA